MRVCLIDVLDEKNRQNRCIKLGRVHKPRLHHYTQSVDQLLLTESSHHAFALLLVFGFAKLLAELFERISIPGMVGEILAGLIIGPALLNWIAPEPFLNSLSELGVMFLLFRVGLEVKPAELFAVGWTASLVALGGVLLPFLFGWAVMTAFGMPRIQGIFIGAALVATSVGITAQVLSARGVLWHRSSQIILAAAVMDDVLGLLVLAVITGMAKGGVNLGGIALTAVMTLAFVALIGFYGTRAVSRIAPGIQNMRAVESEFSIAMVLLFALSLAAIFVGVAAIVGAFLAGMAFSESAGQRLHDLTSGATELLLPFFLAGIGLHLQLDGFGQPGMVALTLALLVVAILSKLFGCGLGALGASMKDRIRIGVGMMPRGEVGMVVAQLGLSMGVLTQPLYAILVAVCVATTVIAPPMLTFLYREVEPQSGPQEYPPML